jgi:hypothetical protein
VAPRLAPRLRSNARTYEGELKDMLTADVQTAGISERSFAAARLPSSFDPESEIALVNDAPLADQHASRPVSIDGPSLSDAWQYPEPPPRILVESPPWWELRSRLLTAVNCINTIPNTYVPNSAHGRVSVAAALDRQYDPVWEYTLVPCGRRPAASRSARLGAGPAYRA